MTVKRFLFFFGIVSISLSTQVLAQNRGMQIVPPSGRDPFTLALGRSFSASGSGRRPGSRLSSGVSKEAVASDFEEALDIVRNNHVSGRSLNTETLTTSAISSMLKMLDPHSNYYDVREYQNLLGEHESEYSGTGSSIAGYLQGSRLGTYIVSTFPESPAAKARLRFGDRIIAVDGQDVSGQSPDTVRDLVRGRRGTIVRMTIERADTGAIETVEMRRDRVHERAVPAGYFLSPGIGYIDLTGGFSYATFPEFEAALTDLHNHGMTSLVLDMRRNGGGILDQAVKVAEKFLPAGSTIVSERGRYPGDTRTWKAAKTGYEAVPMVLLVDENTASASEVLAGALQDNDRALIVGARTFGKGLVQSVLNLPFGSGLTLTAARYYTPSGRSIQRDYSETGLYDYFNHRGKTAVIGTASYAAKTLTNRVVYGGDGILPDVASARPPITREQISLLDPIFFFSREFVNGRLAADDQDNVASKQAAASREGAEVSDEIVNRFIEFAKGPSWNRSSALLTREQSFLRELLSYNLALAYFGTEAADQIRIKTDPEVKRAVTLLPNAARLQLSAERARIARRNEKSSLSLFLNEQR